MDGSIHGHQTGSEDSESEHNDESEYSMAEEIVFEKSCRNLLKA